MKFTTYNTTEIKNGSVVVESKSGTGVFSKIREFIAEGELEKGQAVLLSDVVKELKIAMIAKPAGGEELRFTIKGRAFNTRDANQYTRNALGGYEGKGEYRLVKIGKSCFVERIEG